MMSAVFQWLRVRGVGRAKTAFFVVTLVFALVVATGVALGLRSVSSRGETTPAPAELAGHQLVQAATGAEALAEVDGLHGKGIDAMDAWIGRYEGGGTIWVAEAGTEENALKLLDDMVRGIEDGDSPYQGLTQDEFEGVSIYAVRDASQHHFFYQTRTRVAWVATPPGAEEGFLSEALANVR
jgi:hypothetical protein